MPVSQFIEQMPVAIVLLDDQGTITHANPPAQQLLGLPLVEQIWGDVVGQIFRPRLDDGHEVSLIDGRRLKLQLAPRTDQPGQMILLTDLTETRRLQEQLAQMQRLGTVGRMVAKLAHQIRTPLSAALLYSSQLAQGRVPMDKQQRFAGRVVARLKDLEQQINDLLLFAKSGERPMLESIQLDALLEQLEHSCAAVLTKEQCRLVVPGQTGITLQANASSLCGALTNLVDNAARASGPGGGITVEIQQQNSLLQLSVADTGPGVPPELQEQIFEPFFTTHQQGTGLGLAVVRQVALAHQGRVFVTQAESGPGARFVLELPVQIKQP